MKIFKHVEINYIFFNSHHFCFSYNDIDDAKHPFMLPMTLSKNICDNFNEITILFIFFHCTKV